MTSLRAGTLLLIFLVLAVVVNSFASSLLFQKKDRVNLVILGENTAFYSLSFANNINYAIYFSPDRKIFIPGGYRYYRIGALGELVRLEKNPDILKKAFSSATSTFISYYFYPTKKEIRYGTSVQERVYFPGFREMFLTHSNAGILDRIYLYSQFLGSKKNDFALIQSLPTSKTHNEEIFLENEFAKQYQGFFYQKAYRMEKKTVQIIYTKSYKTAFLVSRILEGNGIRVVDLAANEKRKGGCTVQEDTSSFSKTAKDISKYFHCKAVKGKTEISDIIVYLGDREEKWSGE